MSLAISVIMSVYNSEKYLKESVESILNQTFTDFEFIIINDKSSDKSEQILENFEKNDKRIKLYNNTENLGLTKSLNKALKLAKGKYIARMDADDISYSVRFEKQFNFLEKQSDIFLVGSMAIEINQKGNQKGILKVRTSTENINKRLQQTNAFIHPSIMFRNEGFYYREKFQYTQDYDFYLCLLSADKKMANIPEILVKYRLNKMSISIQKTAQQRLFAQKANYFYHEREKHGKDSYQAFNKNVILNTDVVNSSDKTVLQAEIYSALKFFNENLIRKNIKKYFKFYGYFNKFLLYFVISYLGKNFYLKAKKTLSL